MTRSPTPEPAQFGHPRTKPTDPATVRTWAAPLLRAANQVGPIPDLGTRDWQTLPNTDPRKLAAVLHTALAYLAENTEEATAARLRTELDEVATAIRRMFSEASAEVSQAARERRARGYQTGPSYAELIRRRNTHRCRTCGTTFYGPIACPTGCDTAEQIHTRAAASWAAIEAEIHTRHRRSA